MLLGDGGGAHSADSAKRNEPSRLTEARSSDIRRGGREGFGEWWHIGEATILCELAG